MNKLDRFILSQLYKNNGKIFLFSLLERYRLTPAEVHNSSTRLLKKELVSIDGLILTTTRKGKSFLEKERYNLSLYTYKPWRSCPDHFKQSILGINQPYFPRISLLDSHFFIEFAVSS